MVRSRHTGWPLLVAGVLALLLVSLPGSPDSPLGGAPLDLWGYAAVAIVATCVATAFFFPPRRWAVWSVCGLLAVLGVAKVTIGAGATPAGWRASYDFADTKGRMHAADFYRPFRSSHERWEPAVALWSQRADLHFLNDVDLFGYPPYDGTPREIRYAIRAVWTGYVAPGAEPVTWMATAVGDVTVTTAAGSRRLHDPTQHVETFTPGPTGGTIVVEYLKPANVAPFVNVVVLDGQAATPVPVTASPGLPTTRRTTATTLVVVVGLALFATMVLAGLVRHGSRAPEDEWLVRAFALSATLGLLGWGTTVALKWHGLTTFLGAGGDPLYYGSSARDILHHGVLMLHGAAPGTAAPFYFYPFYPYLLAAGHALFGDSAGAAYLLNGLLQACLPALFFLLGWRRLTVAAGFAAFLALGAFLYTYQRLIFEFDQPSFTDIAYMTAVLAALVALTRAVETMRPVSLVVAGVAVALGAATRPSLMTLMYLAPLALALGIRPFALRRWLIASAFLVCGVGLGLLPFTLRNFVAAGKFVVLVNSWIQIPYFLIPPEIPEKPGGAPQLLEAVRMGWDIFAEHPVRTMTVEARKVLYTLGVTAAGPREMAQAPGLAVLPPLFLWALWRRRIPSSAAIVVGVFAVSHGLAMLIAAPWTFHYKSVLPLHAAFLFGAAFLLPRRAPSGTGDALPAGARDAAS
jgi:hypothetical protein